MSKSVLCGIIGSIGAVFTGFFGGWDQGLITLVTFMCVDYISGLIVAGVFKKSEKTESGALESRAGWKGLCRKGMVLLIVMIAYRLDLLIRKQFFRIVLNTANVPINCRRFLWHSSQ